jgi:hypothetical protein
VRHFQVQKRTAYKNFDARGESQFFGCILDHGDGEVCVKRHRVHRVGQKLVPAPGKVGYRRRLGRAAACTTAVAQFRFFPV